MIDEKTLRDLLARKDWPNDVFFMSNPGFDRGFVRDMYESGNQSLAPFVKPLERDRPAGDQVVHLSRVNYEFRLSDLGD